MDQNLRARQTEARKADVIIEAGVREYVEEIRSLGAVDSVKEYRALAENIREQELQRALRALAKGEDPEQVTAQLARSITNKLLHAPTAGLKQVSIDGRFDVLVSARKLLGLSELETAEQPSPESEAESDITRFENLDPGDTAGRTLQ